MSALNRRAFLKTTGVAGAALATGVAGAAAACAPAASGAPAPLDPAALTALAEVTLPDALGADGRGRAVNGFQAWLAAYRPGAEMTHGYGTGELSYTPAHPGPGWAAQLEALDLEAQQRFGKHFAQLDAASRRDLLTRQLARERGDRLPDPTDAHHVAVGLLAWWAQTPEAADLCYGARIDPHTCRPLAAQAEKPAAL
jgi:hypothetical protein